ncbi:hypothetical protein M408DRAFT_31155 [Serendipita vermifera MAFF 305830]|uniref:CxC2-like cysteine cluster KDZ transposase-associated domain-containing protein n=1 Tax=Serendipita vermifera MAFF 305830 TaxID=933852 RepID=A0A0C3A4C0_SERVB|nr:hypothetical protein M408DRAFT_31155 [Serendipita vermifera MAFF 305830]
MSSKRTSKIHTIAASFSKLTRFGKWKTQIVTKDKTLAPPSSGDRNLKIRPADFSPDELYDDYDTLQEATLIVKERTTKTHHEFMAEWFVKLPQYLSAILKHESIGTLSLCKCDGGDLATYKCQTCTSTAPCCRTCIATNHKANPLHRIVFWNGQYFESVKQSAIGITMSLPHTSSGSCLHRISKGGITVVDINGFHEIDIDICGCDDAATFDIQLLSSQLFAASVVSPKTAFTFQLLELFRVLHFDGKTSVHTFVGALTRLTTSDDFDSRHVMNRTREFRRVTHQWNYLCVEKQSIVADTSSCLLALCPACPRPGMNMPHDWFDKTPLEKHWIARLIMHYDANFRLVLERQRHESSKDIGLWRGNAFFVEDAPYRDYLRVTDAPQQLSSTCSNHRAISDTNRSRFNTLDVTGIAGAVCRHECAIPGSFVNLFKGERYVNSDYAISNALSRLPNLKEIVLSYDIACQYSKQFFSRIDRSPLLRQPNARLTFLVPKFHLPAHKEECRFQYSFNYAKGVGRTDGEAIERFWSPHNRLSGSTSKMTPNYRMDTLNSNFYDWNPPTLTAQTLQATNFTTA